MSRLTHYCYRAFLCALAATGAQAQSQPAATATESFSHASFSLSIDAQLVSDRHRLLRNSNIARELNTVREFYAQRQSRPGWLQGSTITRQGVLLLQLLRSADDYGLRLDDYYGTSLTYRAIELVTDHSAPPAAYAELDLGMSIAAARLLRHLHFGRIDPRAAGFDLSAPRAPFDAVAALEELTTSDDIAKVVAGVEPTFLHYQLLKRAMHKYRLLAVDRELTVLPSFSARSIKLGEEYAGIPALRRLLVALDDLPGDVATSDTVLDKTLAAGLARFQQRHGLEVDGALGRKTLAALTVPLSVRAQQLAMGLERWRWLPEFSSPPIVVNIPQFRLFALRENTDRSADILQMDVIVGKTYPTMRTPAFTAELKYVVFRPYWDVPRAVLEEELLPEIRADLHYLANNNFEIVRNDSTSEVIAPSLDAIGQLAAGTVRLRQQPGENNSLGLIKLMLPNSYNVYLHSTPAKHLFNETSRAFSHGCIRLSDPAGLAAHVLRNESGEWTRDKIEAAMHDESPEGNNRHVFLSKPIPVLIVYGTAMALENGDVQFFADIYEHDATLKKLLAASR